MCLILSTNDSKSVPIINTFLLCVILYNNTTSRMRNHYALYNEIIIILITIITRVHSVIWKCCKEITTKQKQKVVNCRINSQWNSKTRMYKMILNS